MELLQFVVLGLAVGALYALIAQGLVMIYRGSGVVNLAQGAFAMLGAFLYYRGIGEYGWPTPVAWLVALAVPAALGAATHLLIMARLRRASSLVRLVSTLGVFFLLTATANQIWGYDADPVTSPLPHAVRSPFGEGSAISEDRLYLIGIAIVVTAVLTLVFRRTRFGHATDAVAENHLAASGLGLSPDRIAATNWALGAALAAVTGVFLAPILFLNVAALALHRAARPGGGAVRPLRVVLADARRGVRHRGHRIGGRALHRGSGRVRPVHVRGRAVPRHVHERVGLPLDRVPGDRHGAVRRQPRSAPAQRAARPPSGPRIRPRPRVGHSGGGRARRLPARQRSRRLGDGPHHHDGDVDRLLVDRPPDGLRRPALAGPVGAGRVRCVGGRPSGRGARLAVPPRVGRRHRRHDPARRPLRRARTAHSRRQPRRGHARPLGSDQRAGDRQLGPHGRLRRHTPGRDHRVRDGHRRFRPPGTLRHRRAGLPHRRGAGRRQHPTRCHRAAVRRRARQRAGGRGTGGECLRGQADGVRHRRRPRRLGRHAAGDSADDGGSQSVQRVRIDRRHRLHRDRRRRLRHRGRARRAVQPRRHRRPRLRGARLRAERDQRRLRRHPGPHPHRQPQRDRLRDGARGPWRARPGWPAGQRWSRGRSSTRPSRSAAHRWRSSRSPFASAGSSPSTTCRFGSTRAPSSVSSGPTARARRR